MPVSDVYTIVNSVVGQALGTTALTATNAYQLVDMVRIQIFDKHSIQWIQFRDELVI